jgi:hypothetical protein
MLSSFVVGWFVCPGAVLDYGPGGWVKKLHMVHDAHPFILQIHTSRSEIGWWGDMVWHREAFHRFEVKGVTEFNSD